MIKLQEIKQILEIDLTSPSGLRWKTNRGKKMKLGDIAGRLGNDGYYRVGINYKTYSIHRIVYALFHDLELDQLPKYVDHIDRNPSNNDPDNLRPCTQSQNIANTDRYKNNTSGFKGVSWCKRDKEWIARINIYGKNRFLGRFDSIEDAAKAYEEAALKYYGEFAVYF